MKNQTLKSNSILLAIIAIVGWSAVFLRLYLTIINHVASFPEAIVRFISFFTIQSNILVAVCFTFLWLKPKSKWGQFFSNSKNSTAITLYITIVGLVYNAVLRSLWTPTGLQRVVDELLHLVIPILVLIFWFLYVPKMKLVFKNIFPWLIFPFVYLVYTLVRGAFFNFYPYPFVDVILLGYSAVFVNSFFMLIAFLVIGMLLVGIGKMGNKKLE